MTRKECLACQGTGEIRQSCLPYSFGCRECSGYGYVYGGTGDEWRKVMSDALWVLDNMSSIMNASGLESTLTDPRPAMRVLLEQSPNETGNPGQGCTKSEQEFRLNENIRSEAQFLIERLGQFEADNLSDETARDWYGHVVPSMETLRLLIARAAA